MAPIFGNESMPRFHFAFSLVKYTLFSKLAEVEV